MRCPKCDGESVFPAMNEAPEGVRDWRKCLSCGKRWDPTTDEALDTVKRAFEEWQPEEDDEARAADPDEDETIEQDLDVEEPEDLDEPVVTSLDLAMKDVLVRRGRKKKEAQAMPKFVSEEHRERWIAGQKLSRQLKRDAAGGGHGQAKKKPGRPKRVPAAVVSVPAMREPETLATPRPVQQNGQVLSVLDAVIVDLHADVAALERTREILSRQVIQ